MKGLLIFLSGTNAGLAAWSPSDDPATTGLNVTAAVICGLLGLVID